MSLPPFETLVEEHGAAVMRACRALLAPADAEDAWSETFLAALRAYPRLEPGSDARAWLVTLAHRKAIDQLRRNGRAPRAADVGSLEGARGPREPDEELRAALGALAPKQRGAVVWRYLAELSYEDVGALLGCTPAAARRSAADGVARLRERWKKGRTR